MNFRELLFDANALLALGAVSAGTSDTQTFTEVDMLGFNSLMFIAALGTITSTGTAKMSAKASNTTGTYGSGTVDSLTNDGGTTVQYASANDTMSNKLLVLDFHRIPRRYVQGQIERATANVVITGVIAIRYNANQKPTTQTSVVGASAAVADPVPSAA